MLWVRSDPEKKNLLIVADYLLPYLEKPSTAEQGIICVVRNICWSVRVNKCSEDPPEYSPSHGPVEISL